MVHQLLIKTIQKTKYETLEEWPHGISGESEARGDSLVSLS